MRKSGHSKFYPQNTSVLIVEKGIKAELFWQTVNANHILENYVSNVTNFDKDHDLKFNDFSKLLKGNVFFKFGDRRNYAICYDRSKGTYYYIAFVLEKRFNHWFILIITAYATKSSHYIKEYEQFQEIVRKRYS